ncbi:ABC transporter substrate-binding protein [Campylobacter sp. RM16187]|uniref:ABC transporter substrate-binding protein n=1 Tax=Campylobacter sp. RM16187 TaxID=1660063 RepID=UPI0021B5A170|nr:ABC transporter substrate-binding protein [Campylobacter sp. RM16187]QKG30034.1 ABC transporter, periplasmic substrate-binding protein [Campylobacter sp. RM16187]
MKKLSLVSLLILGLLSLNASEFRSVKDMAGNEVKIPAVTKKIGALWHANNQMILTVGGADKIVATTDKIKQNKWFAHIYKPIAQIPASLNGNDIQIEELVKLAPDAIIVSNKNYREELVKHGFNVFYALFTNYDDMKKSVMMTAEIIGDDAVKKAKEFNDYFDANFKLVNDVTSKISASDRPKVLHILNGTNLLKVDGKKTIINEWIELAGGVNAIEKEGNMIEITAEEIIKADPDVIIVGGVKNEQAVEKIYKDVAFSGLKAVKDKRVYGNPSGVFSWDRYGSEGALQILWAAKTLHPEKFQNIDMKAETKKFYKRFMNYELSDEEFGYILKGLSPEGK